jgi:hypothetical protein
MDIYHVQDAASSRKISLTGKLSLTGKPNHAEDMWWCYLSNEKILVNADLHSPPAAAAKQPPAAPTPGKLALYQNVGQLKLDVERHVPIHGRVGTNGEFLKIAGKAQ